MIGLGDGGWDMTVKEAQEAIPAGVYRHFKGNYYRMLAVAGHSETNEAMVVYRALYGEGGLWVRPAEMWNETVEWGGEKVRRFHLLDTEERIAFYEQIYRELGEAIRDENADRESCRLKAAVLDSYYTSGDWRRDYELDEAGLLPKDLRRGVLSQDGVYNLLSEWQEREEEEEER